MNAQYVRQLIEDLSKLPPDMLVEPPVGVKVTNHCVLSDASSRSEDMFEELEMERDDLAGKLEHRLRLYSEIKAITDDDNLSAEETCQKITEFYNENP